VTATSVHEGIKIARRKKRLKEGQRLIVPGATCLLFSANILGVGGGIPSAHLGILENQEGLSCERYLGAISGVTSKLFLKINFGFFLREKITGDPDLDTSS